MYFEEYKLSCELSGHSADVRAVIGVENSIISGSRDKLVKIWKNEGNAYHEADSLSHHSNFVASLCIIETKLNEKWLCTSSNDCTICVYVLGERVPFTTLRGHSSTVCSMAMGCDDGTLITGSWDKTARIWYIIPFEEANSIELHGHEAAVWAVATFMERNQYVTGSADKTIIIWHANGDKFRVINEAHMDCIRGIAILPDETFATCSNDAIIKYWTMNGDSMGELYGHSSYVYSIVYSKKLCGCLTAGEDGTVRLWDKVRGEVKNCIKLPAESVWSVAYLDNDDIVTGTSDGVVRVFTKDPARFANESEEKAFNEAVQARIDAQNKEIGGIQVTDLPGPEKLLNVGREGQKTMIRYPDGSIKCHQFENGEWKCLGDVTGAAEPSAEGVSKGKTKYAGKEYDYVFDIDISESSPPLKLPYNCDEDPWVVAQKFIHTNFLPQVYLEQVANFIIKNATNRINVAVAPETEENSFQDPFTGSSRYVPDANTTNTTNNTTSNQNNINVDPFTGSSSYSSGKQENAKKHFPTTQYKMLEVCQPLKVQEKLKEFNNKVPENLKMSEDGIKIVVTLCELHFNNSIDVSLAVNTLRSFLKWPKDLLFPVLDVTRMAVRHTGIAKKLFTAEMFECIIENIHNLQPPANQLMAVRCLSNLMNHEYGRELIIDEMAKVIRCTMQLTEGTPNLQLAITTLYLNATIVQLRLSNQDVCRLMTESIIDCLNWITDVKALYCGYTALGNLTCTPYGHITKAQIVSVESLLYKIKMNIDTVHPHGFQELNEVAKDLRATL